MKRMKLVYGTDKDTVIKKALNNVLGEHIDMRVSKFECSMYDIIVNPKINVIYEITDIPNGHVDDFKVVLFDDFGMIHNNMAIVKIYARINEEERERLRKLIPLENQEEIDTQFFNECEQLIRKDISSTLAADFNLSKNIILKNVKLFSAQVNVTYFISSFFSMFYIGFREMIKAIKESIGKF